MFPYPRRRLHVGHPLGYIATDVYARYQRMTGHNVLHTMGFDAFGLPAEQYAVKTGQHPRVTTEAQHRQHAPPAAPAGPGPRHPARASRPPTPRTTAGPSGSSCRSSTAGTTSGPDRARPIDDLVAEFASGERPVPGGRRLGRADARRSARGDRLAPAGLHRRGAGQLVPRPGHGAGQRGGHRRRPQRQRQLPGLPAAAAPVDDAHHRLRRAADRRPGPAGLAGERQAAAAQLDRRQRRRRHLASRWPQPAERRSRSSPPARHPVRRDLLVLAPEHPLVDTLVPDAWPDGTPGRWRGRHAARRGRGRLPERRRAAERPAAHGEAGAKTGVFTGAYAINPVSGEPIPVFIADYVLMGYGTGAIMAVPATTSATSSSPRFGCRSAWSTDAGRLDARRRVRPGARDRQLGRPGR